MAGIGTNPVEGRWGAAIWGGDIAGGTGQYQAGLWGGDPISHLNPILLPTTARRTALLQAPEVAPTIARRTQLGRAVRKP